MTQAELCRLWGKDIQRIRWTLTHLRKLHPEWEIGYKYDGCYKRRAKPVMDMNRAWDEYRWRAFAHRNWHGFLQELGVR